MLIWNLYHPLYPYNVVRGKERLKQQAYETTIIPIKDLRMNLFK
jgi:hypothetical protein